MGIIAIVIPIATGLKYGEMSREIHRFVGAGVTVIGSPVNALFLARIVLPPTVLFFLPLFVSLVAGDQVSGEAAEGTLRGLLSRPVPRLSLLAAKFTVSAVYAVSLTFFLALVAFLVGWAFFGLGGLVSMWGGLNYFGMREGLYRLGISYGHAAVYQVAVTGIAFMLSVFVTNSLAPVVGTMGLLVVFGAIGEIPFFASIRPFLFTSYTDIFPRVFAMPLNIGEIWADIGRLIAWALGTFIISMLIFGRKDVLT